MIPENMNEEREGVFVTAKLRGKAECRQGWVIQTDPLRIRGESGTEYDCEGQPTAVVNPPTPSPFRVCWRNPGHWDINTDEGRWKIRGESGNFSVQDERYRPYPVWEGFATVNAAMAFVCSKLMREILPPNAESIRAATNL